MTTLETLITQYGEACMESARNSGYDGADKHDSSVARMDAARAALVLAVDAALAARQAAEPVAWMHEDGKRTVAAADKLHIETLTFGHWPNVAKGYTVPLYTHPAPQGQEGGWQPIASAPVYGKERPRQMFVVRAFNVCSEFTGGRPYTSDPWCTWRLADGEFARWPHPFQPTHWHALPPALASKDQT